MQVVCPPRGLILRPFYCLVLAHVYFTVNVFIMDHSLFNLCLQFNSRVCAELQNMPELAREMLKGDYLFVIDNVPLFIMLVDVQGAWSILLKPKQKFDSSENTPQN